MKDQNAPATPEAASARIAELKADADFSARYASGDPAAVAEFSRLHEIAYPTAPSSGFTPEQLRTMAADLVQRGTLTQEQADEALLAHGVEQPQGSLDERLAASGFAPARPEQYEIPASSVYGSDVAGDPALREFDAHLRGALAVGKFPREHGSALAAELVRVIDRGLRFKSDDEHELYAREQMATLRDLWREKTLENIALARQLAKEIDAKQPGFLDLLAETAAGDSAMVLLSLFNQAQRLQHVSNVGRK